MERVDNLFEFGPFCLDAVERVLLRDGRLVPLPPKALSTLLVLIRKMGHVVEKDVLMAEVWPDEDVEEGNLAQHIFMLRKALGETNESPNYIETIPRRGYRFISQLVEPKVEFAEAASDTRQRGQNHRRSTDTFDGQEISQTPQASSSNENAERQVANDYPEDSDAYQAYLKGRYCWSNHTRESLEQAIGYFRKAITLGPDFALAYAGIVDCYLRLATNYLLPVERVPKTDSAMFAVEIDETHPEAQASTKIRCEWDKSIAERERRRARELQSDDLAVHQWYAAYLFSRSLYKNTLLKVDRGLNSITDETRSLISDVKLPSQCEGLRLTLEEEVQVFCVIAREQIDAGNYDAASAVLERWWTMAEWPKLAGLNAHSSADLLFTAGTLARVVASTKPVSRGQKHAEALLSGAISLFEQLGSKTLSAEGRIELGFCYYREGMFDLARTTLMAALEELSENDRELRSISLTSLASVERHGGRLRNSFAILKEVAEIAELSPWATARYHLERATTLNETRSELAIEDFEKALEIFKAIGNHRHTAIAENNHGYLYLLLGRLDEVETHLILARKLFDGFDDKVRRAQVDETLAQLHLAARRFELAEQAILRSVDTLETGGEEALLAESLTTQGRILSQLGHQREAKRVLDRAYAVAERCGYPEGAARALLTEVEEMCDQLEDDERLELGARLDHLLADSQQVSTLDRLRKCHELIASAHERVVAH